MIIAISSDHGGYELKEDLKRFLTDGDYQFRDFGCDSIDSVDYPDYAATAAGAVARGDADFAIIVCGTGIGVAIAANKINGIRAANCGDCFSARMARAHNNANVLTLGQRVIGVGLAREIAGIFLTTAFDGGRHSNRVEKIHALETQR